MSRPRTARKDAEKLSEGDGLPELGYRKALNWEIAALTNNWEPPQSVAARQRTELNRTRILEITRRALGARPREKIEAAAQRVAVELMDQREALRLALEVLDDGLGNNIELRERIRALVTK